MHGHQALLGEGPLYDGLLAMTDDMHGPSPMPIKYVSYNMTNFAYDGPIFLVPLSLSYANLPVLAFNRVEIG